MRKFLGFTAASFLFFISAAPASAALLTINKEGIVAPNVLSYETSSLEVKKLAGIGNTTRGVVSLANVDGETKLTYTTSTGEHSLDISDLNQDLIEIEERKSPQKLVISQENGQFVIAQGDVSAVTSHEITLDTAKNEFAIKTNTGSKFLATLPSDALSFLDKSNILNTLENNQMSLEENESGELVYVLTGEKIVKPLDLFAVNIPVTASVSAQSGKIVKVDGPIWYKIFGFLLV